MMERTVRAPYSELFVNSCGWEACERGHRWGPAIRDYYLIHFILRGRGQYRTGDACYALGAGEGFLILPGVVTVYEADARDPWEYRWIGYGGQYAAELTQRAGLSAARPCFQATAPQTVEEILRGCYQDVATLRLGGLSAIGGLCRFLAHIAQSDARQTQEELGHYEKALWFIEGNVSRNIQVTDIADFVGLSRSQLFRVFRTACGQSPQQALLDARLRRAKALLIQNTLSLHEIALSSGFSGAAHLGEAFRRRYGMTPGAYRRKSDNPCE